MAYWNPFQENESFPEELQSPFASKGDYFPPRSTEISPFVSKPNEDSIFLPPSKEFMVSKDKVKLLDDFGDVFGPKYSDSGEASDLGLPSDVSNRQQSNKGEVSDHEEIDVGGPNHTDQHNSKSLQQSPFQAPVSKRKLIEDSDEIEALKNLVPKKAKLDPKVAYKEKLEATDIHLPPPPRFSAFMDDLIKAHKKAKRKYMKCQGKKGTKDCDEEFPLHDETIIKSHVIEHFPDPLFKCRLCGCLVLRLRRHFIKLHQGFELSFDLLLVPKDRQLRNFAAAIFPLTKRR